MSGQETFQNIHSDSETEYSIMNEVDGVTDGDGDSDAELDGGGLADADSEAEAENPSHATSAC